MASACVNNIGVPPENFLDCQAKYSSYGWLSPRISFSREYTTADEVSAAGGSKSPDKVDLESPAKDVGDFEFRLDDPAIMLPADELFSAGKLVPLQLSSVRPPATSTATAAAPATSSPETAKSCLMSNDPYLFSPKAPRCSSRWRELLGLKKLYQTTTNNNNKQENNNGKTANKSIRLFLHRNSKTASSSSGGGSDPSLSLPLLKDSSTSSECCCESSSSTVSRLSLSSSSSSGGGHDHDDLPHLSFDATASATDKPQNPPRVRMVRAPNTTTTGRVGRSPMRRGGGQQQDAGAVTMTTPRGVSVDSPRMNSSGKVVFQSLERSSSSPSSFNGGVPRYKHRGMERSYSANVRITPVLNVPVCSLRGSSKSGVFGLFSSSSSSSSSQSQKKEANNGGNNGGSSRNHHHHHHHGHPHSSRNRKDSS